MLNSVQNLVADAALLLIRFQEGLMPKFDTKIEILVHLYLVFLWKLSVDETDM